ncbi:MAG: preprotein translocase subunit SecE [Erysipelotrichaceae bacterium]|jgi:preprotein translocase SecE subunit|nr:preprotein translocase subunit SecE [Erysipelotrichaceae bacterium]
MKWFSLSAIWKEISKIRWPKKEDLLVNSVQVIIFTGFFVLFFALCLAAISALLNALGVL